MRRLSPAWSIPLLSIAAACGAPKDVKPVASPSPVTATLTVTSAIGNGAHAPVPALPPGVEAASVDPMVSPCDDFFQYACGGWTKSHPIPADQAAWGRFDVLAEANENTLRRILERDAAKSGDADPYADALGDFYGSCIDAEAVERDGLRAITPELKRIEGVTDAAGLARVLGRLHAMGVQAFFLLGAEPDFKDATREIAAIDQGGLGMPDRDYYLKDDEKTVALRGKYVAHAERMFALLGDGPDQARREARAVFALEKSLAEAQMSRTDKRDPQKVYHPMDRARLAKVAPGFPWDTYFEALGFPGIRAINVYEPDYVGALHRRVAAATRASWAEEIRPYLRLRLASTFARSLPRRFVDEAFSFDKEATGQAELSPRWKRCVRAVDRGMGEALAVPFVREKLGVEGKQATVDAVSAIEASMLADLAGLPWMDEATRARAMEKVHKIANKIGYPDRWRRYDGLRIDRASYTTNAMRANELETGRQLGKIGKPVDHGEWGMTPPTVNAYYDPSLNEMVFPAGILQTPFYWAAAPRAVNLGAIGMVMGHELTHGFDDEGRQFDGDGNLEDWWTPAVSTEFERRAACVEDQFDGYVSVDDLHVNGKLTLGENLADLGGLKLALAALHSRAATAPEEDRQFFLGFAQSWCEGERPERSRMLVRIDPHSPARFRVNGPLSNMGDFAAAFSCRAGDGMVRPAEKQCSVW